MNTFYRGKKLISMKMFDENLLSISTSLTGDHLGLAMEAFCRLREEGRKGKLALSSILHAFSGLESAVNYICFETFF